MELHWAEFVYLQATGTEHLALSKRGVVHYYIIVWT
jgi:hypothetical protein